MKNRANDKVVVTGIGAITALGDWKETWQSLLEGESGIEKIQRFKTDPYTSKIAAEVHLNAKELLGPKLARRTSRFQQYALLAAREAVRNAGLVDSTGQLVEGINKERVGVSLGVGLPSPEAISELLQQVDNPKKVSPNVIMKVLQGNATFLIAKELGIVGGLATTNTDACNAGTTAIGIGKTAIEHWGWVDVVLAGGTDELVQPLAFTGFEQMAILAKDTEACRPYDSERGGFPIGEGAVILVLERLSHAIGRGARILAILAGFGMATSGYNAATPHPEGLGVRVAAERALKDAGIPPNKIGLIVTHGVSTVGDVGEAAAITALFGKKQPPVCSVTPNLGHPMGPAGALKAAVAVSALDTGEIPPTLNFSRLHPDCATLNPGLKVCTERRTFKGEAAMSWSAGLAGVEGCLVWERWQDREEGRIQPSFIR